METAAFTQDLSVCQYDGSASVVDVPRYLRADESDIEMAISDGSEKPRLFLFQFGNGGKRKICALGGHGFPVLSPLGNWPISKESAASYLDLQSNPQSPIQSSIVSISPINSVSFSILSLLNS